jgi:hypothetical protein
LLICLCVEKLRPWKPSCSKKVTSAAAVVATAMPASANAFLSAAFIDISSI